MDYDRIQDEQDKVADMPVTKTSKLCGMFWRSVTACPDSPPTDLWYRHLCDEPLGHHLGADGVRTPHRCTCGMTASPDPAAFQASQDLLDEAVRTIAAQNQEQVDRTLTAIDQDLDLDPTRNRVAFVQLTHLDLERFLDLPEDMHVCGIWADPMTQSLNLQVRSPRLEEVAPGSMLPLIPTSGPSRRLTISWVDQDEQPNRDPSA